MPIKQVIVVIDHCVIDGLTHEIALDLNTVLIQGLADDGAPVEVHRDVILTCPTTGRQFRATIPLQQGAGEVITGARERTVAGPFH